MNYLISYYRNIFYNQDYHLVCQSLFFMLCKLSRVSLYMSMFSWRSLKLSRLSLSFFLRKLFTSVSVFREIFIFFCLKYVFYKVFFYLRSSRISYLRAKTLLLWDFGPLFFYTRDIAGARVYPTTLLDESSKIVEIFDLLFRIHFEAFSLVFEVTLISDKSKTLRWLEFDLSNSLW